MAVIISLIANHTKQGIIGYSLVKISSIQVVELTPSPSAYILSILPINMYFWRLHLKKSLHTYYVYFCLFLLMCYPQARRQLNWNGGHG